MFIQAITRELRDLKTKMQGVMEEKENLNSENQEVTKRRAKLELMIKDIQDELEGDKSARVYIACFLKEFAFLDTALSNYFIHQSSSHNFKLLSYIFGGIPN